jgi:hypothetical protein
LFSVATKLTVRLHGRTGTAASRTQSYTVENSEFFHSTFPTTTAVYPEALNQQKDEFVGLLLAMQGFVSAFHVILLILSEVYKLFLPSCELVNQIRL